MTPRQKLVFEFHATSTCRCSKVAKVQGDRPSDIENFSRLLDRCEDLVFYSRFEPQTVASMDKLRQMVADSDEIAAMMEQGYSEQMVLRFDAVVERYTGSSEGLQALAESEVV